MIKIRERQNSYGLLVTVLLIIIMVLISYIAYGKGLEKKDKTTTTTTKALKEKINKLYTLKELCNEEKKCNKDIIELNELKIKLASVEEENIITHNLIFSGKIDKTISLNRFISLQILDSSFFIIEETSAIESEINTLTLYDENLTKLDKLEINNLLDKSTDNLELIYYTYDETCQSEDNKYFIKNTTLITDNGFSLITSTKGPLKEKGFVC